MGNVRWLKRRLQELPASSTIVELGAGDGALAHSIPESAQATWIACDLAPRPEHWPESWQWHEGDLFTALPQISGTAALGNLILHHFSEAQLQTLGGFFTKYDRILFSEPLRLPRVLFLSRLMELLAINHVTRHDMRVSIRAGFRGKELPSLLELDPKLWDIDIKETWMGAYRLDARRKVTSP